MPLLPEIIYQKHFLAIEKSASHTDFIQSDLWKQKKLLYPNKTLIPYFLYNDDFGINKNPQSTQFVIFITISHVCLKNLQKSMKYF